MAKRKIHPGAYSPAQVLEHARRAALEGRINIKSKVFGELSALGVPLDRVQDAVRIALAEVNSECSKPVDDPFDPPGHGFVWLSKHFERRMYIKLRMEGPKGRVCLYSLHQALYGR